MVKSMKFLIKFLESIDKANKWIALAVSPLLPIMACVLAFETVSRYLFNHPTIWSYDMAIFLFGYLALLSGGCVHQLKAHINVDIVYTLLSPKWKALMDVVTGSIVLFFLLIVIIYSWNPAIEALKIHSTTMSEWGPPVGHYKLMITVATTFLFFQALANWIRSLYKVITDNELEK
jgi:TRAP-type C4-dicarboxylate transport system permease small subunit